MPFAPRYVEKRVDQASAAVLRCCVYVPARIRFLPREAVREGGRVVVYGFQAKLHGGRMATNVPSERHPIRESTILGWYILRNWFLPGCKSMVPYSIQWLMRLKPAWFRNDLLTLFDLLQQNKIKPLIAQRLPRTPARQAHESQGGGGVIGKIVLIPNG